MSDQLLPCPCCGAPASVVFKRNASLGLPGWVSDCSTCIESAGFTRFSREAAVQSWNTYAAQEAALRGEECDLPPRGWRCTRVKGHSGPCAAVECPEEIEIVERAMARLRGEVKP